MATLNTRLVLRNDTKDKWEDEKKNPILMKGEAGIEWTAKASSDESVVAQCKLKIGDGFTHWKDLPYINAGMVSTTVKTSGDGNTIIGAEVSYENGVYTITLFKGYRVEKVSITGDDIITSTNSDPSEAGVEPSFTITHKTGVQYTKTASDIAAIQSKASGSIVIPKIETDAYGHVTAASDETITVDLPDFSNTVTGSELIEDTIILGAGTSSIKTSTKTIVETIGNTTNVPTDKAVKAYVDKEVNKAIVGAMEFKGITTIIPTENVSNGNMYKLSGDVAYTFINGEESAKKGDVIIYYDDDTTKGWYLVPSGDDVEDTWREVAIRNGDSADVFQIFDNIIGENKSLTIAAGDGLKIEKEANTGFIKLSYTGKTTDTTYTAGTGLTLSNDNEFSLKTAAADDIGGIKIGYTERNGTNNYAVKLDGEKAYVTVPWKDTHANSYGTINLVNSTDTTALNENTTSISANKATDSFALKAANKWFILAGTNDDTKTGDSISIGHAISKATKGTYGNNMAKTLSWTDNLNFKVSKHTIDEAGHVTSDEDISITMPNSLVTTTIEDAVTGNIIDGRGIVPGLTASSILLAKHNTASSVWESFIVIDGGNAKTATTINEVPEDASDTEKINFYGYIG